MNIFPCQCCSQLLHFDNRFCEQCGHRLGFIASESVVSALEPLGSDQGGTLWEAVVQPGSRYRFCTNAEYDACNWLVSADGSDRMCLACRHNRTIPDLSISENLLRWQRCEAAKHHLFYSLLRLRLPLATRLEQPVTGLAFDFLAEAPGTTQAKVLTGHDSGVITLNLQEADDVMRERLRKEMGEPYRTLLGHFRHEIGHYYWDQLVQPDPGRLQAFRDCFGDETQDYAQALQAHYANGPAPNWQNSYVSGYATAHPWEDFAESWAHYLHIVDTVEMAGAYHLQITLPVPIGSEEIEPAAFDAYGPGDMRQLIDAWLPITLAVNSINRCMGQPDLYPFVLTPSVVAKLNFIHDLVHGTLMATMADDEMAVAG